MVTHSLDKLILLPVPGSRTGQASFDRIRLSGAPLSRIMRKWDLAVPIPAAGEAAFEIPASGSFGDNGDW